MVQRDKIFYGVVATAVFLCLLIFAWCMRPQEEKQTVQIVIFGDSCYGNIRDESSIADRLEKLSGKTVYNAAFGGTCASRWDKDCRLDYSGDSLSLVALTKAVYAHDFGVQQAIQPIGDITAYFTETIDGLEHVDFSTVETVIIGYGLNDYCLGISLDNEKDLMDENTFAGALRKSAEQLKKVNPDIRIIFATPTYIWLIDSRLTCEEYNGGGGLLEEYVEKEIQVAEELGVEVINLYHDFFPHENWEDWEIYSFDGLHPNEAGRALISEKIATHLEETAK